MRRFIVRIACCVLLLFVAGALAQQPSSPPPDGIKVAPQPVQVDPPSPTASSADLEVAADKLREQSLYRDALDYYDAALKKDGKNAVLWNKRGIALLQLNRLRDAEKSFHKATHYNKKYADAYNNLGVIYYRESVVRAQKTANTEKPDRDYSKAISTYSKAIKLRDDAASFHSNLGMAYFSQGTLQLAAVEFQKALQLDPDIFERTSKAGVSMHLISPEDRAHFAYVLAQMYAKAGNSERALFYLRRALEDGYQHVNDALRDSAFAGVRKDPRFNELMGANRPVSVAE
jgi:tetratricopeptide (TPR) repeat protein